jgi:WD40 repeat protein
MKLEKTKTIHLPTAVLGLTGTPDGARLYAACMDGKVYEVAPATETVTPFSEGHSSYAAGCVLLPDSNTLISAGYDGCLCWHEAASRKLIRRVLAHDFWSWQLALSSDGKRVASVSGQFLAGTEKYEPAKAAGPTVKIFDAVSGELRRSFELLPPVLSVAFSPDGEHIAAANMMGNVSVWSLATGKLAAEFQTPDFTSWGIIKSPHYLGGIYGLAFSPDGITLLCCGMGPMTDPMAGNGKMIWQRWAWKESPPMKQSQIRDNEQGSGLMETIGFAPDGKSFLMGGRQAQGNWNVAMFADADGKLVGSLDTKSRITRHHFASDGTQLFLASAITQPARKEGKWPDYGQIHCVGLEV